MSSNHEEEVVTQDYNKSTFSIYPYYMKVLYYMEVLGH